MKKDEMKKKQMKKDEMKKKQNLGCDLGLISSDNVDFIKTIIFYCSNIDPKGCKSASQVDRFFFLVVVLGPSQGHKEVD
jgi:hypothetical protein